MTTARGHVQCAVALALSRAYATGGAMAMLAAMVATRQDTCGAEAVEAVGEPCLSLRKSRSQRGKPIKSSRYQHEI